MVWSDADVSDENVIVSTTRHVIRRFIMSHAWKDKRIIGYFILMIAISVGLYFLLSYVGNFFTDDTTLLISAFVGLAVFTYLTSKYVHRKLREEVENRVESRAEKNEEDLK